MLNLPYSMKLAFMTDVHANLVALEAALQDMNAQGVTRIIHGGDAIGIGPWPRETLERLHALENRLVPIMGNHDAWYAFGYPHTDDLWLHPNEIQHSDWVHEQLGESFKPWIKTWPYKMRETVHGLDLGFTHYGLKALPDRAGYPLYHKFIEDPRAQDLDELFADFPVDLMFYGHHHPESTVKGRALYMNPGALGCSPTPHARYILLELHEDGSYTLEPRAPEYDDTVLQKAFEEKRVPEREFIRKAFFQGHFEG